MLRRGAGVHERLRNDREAGVDDVALAGVEHEVRVLDQVDPESEGKAVAFPGVDNLVIGDAVLQRLKIF